MPRGGSNAGPCDKHHITDCVACMLPGKASTAVAPQIVHEPVPTEPPDNIEGWITEGAKARIELDDAKAKFEQAQSPNPQAARALPTQAGKSEAVISFDTLPVDDSRASQVTRAAAAYAKASTDYAKAIVLVEALRSRLMIEEAKMHKASDERKAAEDKMKELTNTVVA